MVIFANGAFDIKLAESGLDRRKADDVHLIVAFQEAIEAEPPPVETDTDAKAVAAEGTAEGIAEGTAGGIAEGKAEGVGTA